MGNEEPQSPLNLNAAKWPSPVSNLSPISSSTFAFITEEIPGTFKFTENDSQKGASKAGDELEDPKIEELVYEDISTKFPSSSANKSDGSEGRSSISPSTSDQNPRRAPKTFKINDLLIVDDDDEPVSSPDCYEPKAHIGWASFGESIRPMRPPSPPRPTKILSAPAPIKRKVYIVRQPNRDKAKPYHIASRHSNVSKDTPGTSSSPKSKIIKKSSANNAMSDSDADVDVVGIDEDESAILDFDEVVNPPDLPPQSSLGSRYAFRSKRDYRRGYDSEDEDLINLRLSGSFTPPPQLEPQTTDTQPKSSSPIEERRSKRDDDSIEKRIGELNPSQPLKNGESSSNAESILPLSKSIMERKKVALEMTRNAVIKKPESFKPAYKNKSCAPKDVQIPAYTDKAPVTLYSNVNRPGTYNKDYRGRCVRCRDKSPVDMSTFKFVDDSTVVSVRAHLCDQTRVMIARTAIWNREYARRLGERATGTVWQKPDEVTAQMTGFCSATVRRCIEIANLSIVPRCADRIGVSKHELASLKTTFGTEKFFGQTMKTPHVLTQYYNTKSQNAANKGSGPPSMPRMGRPPAAKKDEEEERKHHPLTNYQPSTSLQSSSTASTSLSTPLKKSVLRWTSLNNPRILRATPRNTPLPRIAVYPVLKKKESDEAGPSTSTSASTETFKAATPGLRKRGRPKKLRPMEMMLRPRRRETPIDKEVRTIVESLVSRVSGGEQK